MVIIDYLRKMSSYNFYNPITIYSTTDSSSISSGGLQIAGGAGIGKMLFVGSRSVIGNGTSALNIVGGSNYLYTTSALNIFTAVTNGGNVADTIYPVLSMI